MKNKPGWLLLLLLASLWWSQDMYAQSRRNSKPTFAQQLWYGGGAGLGFQSFNQQSSFLFALFPMMGYKITESISAGPRLGASYRYIKTVAFDGTIYRFNPIELSGAIFSRAKLFRQFFGHVEYEIANEKDPVNINGIPTIFKTTETNFYVGAGYNSGGKFASEIYVLYNTLEGQNTLEVPWSIRAGFTYNF